MKFFQKRENNPSYDEEKLRPAIRSSICTGEKAAGFLEKETGKFREVMLIRDEGDLESFRREYGIKGEIEVFY